MKNPGFTTYQLAQIFISTPTYKYWQSFSKLRRKVISLFTHTSLGTEHSLTKANIKKYILPSKTFHLWLLSYRLRIFLYHHFLRPFYLLLKHYLPRPLKTKLKHYLGFFRGLFGVGTNPLILNNWARYLESRADDAIDFINFSVISYDYRFQRPQQLAHSLAKKGHRVFYIEAEFNYASRPSRAWFEVKKVAPRVFLVKLSAPKDYFIYQDTPSERGRETIFASLKKFMREARIINPVAKIDHPFWESLINRLKMTIIYDAMDLHEDFAESAASVLTKESRLLAQTDLLLTSSHYLQKKFKSFSKQSLLLNNAGDYVHFAPAVRKLNKPFDLKDIPGPILGYYGALAEWFDTQIVEKILQDFPSASLVLIGRIQNLRLLELKESYSNLHLLGEKSYQELPRYLAHFDVCLIPFKLTPLIKATNPVKIYEYFAAGKPVVSTAIPELQRYAPLLYRARTVRGFSSAVNKALAETDSLLPSRRREVASRETWDSRAELILRTLRPLVFPKVSVVILTYNHPRLSKISVDSVLHRSKYGNLEIIVVDNDSNAETVRMLRQYKGIKNLKLIFNRSNYGFAKGNNIGMKRASGDYLILLNNDVRVTPGWVERLLYHARSEDAGLVGPVTNSIGNESKINIEYHPEKLKELEARAADYTYIHWGETLKLRNIAAFAWLKPRAVYEKLGGLDERFGRGLFEDDDYCIRVGKAGLSILCAEDSFVHHYGGASTNWGSPEYQKLFNTNKEKFEQKWGSKWIPHQYRRGIK